MADGPDRGAGGGAPGPAAAIWRRARRLLLGLALASLVAIGGANAYLLASTASRIHQTAADVSPFPMAIVLGGHINGGQPSTELAARLVAARDLYRGRKVERIIVSGAAHGSYNEPDVMLRWLLRHGVPRDAIALDMLGTRTMATMARAAAVFGVREAVVCTQAYHLPRALFLARKAGIDAVGLAADRSAYARQTLREIVARTAVLAEIAVLGLRAEGIP
jgi:SanA protein